MSLSKPNLQLVSDKDVATSLERLINSVVMERSALQPQQVYESNDNSLDINCLPDEIIEEIFAYLTQNKLGEIARVCRRWNLLTKSPVLWKTVNVYMRSHKHQTNKAEALIDILPSCVSSIRLNFLENEEWNGTLNFMAFCKRLQQKSHHLEKLMLFNSTLYEHLPSVIDVCSNFLEQVKNLICHRCIFIGYSVKNFGCTSKIEVLDLKYSLFNDSYVPQFSKMPCLKVLDISDTNINDSFFEADSSFVSQLEVLNVGYSQITAISFRAMQNHGHNLKQLFLCKINIGDHDIIFNNSAFPHLKTICLSLSHVTCEGVVSLIQSCPALQNVYVNEDVAESFAAHRFVVTNRSKLSIVKEITYYHFLHN